MLSVADALARILADVVPLADNETVELSKAVGRVLAQPVRATRDQPPFDTSAMDGFAVHVAEPETGLASGTAKANAPREINKNEDTATWKIIGEAAAGYRYNRVVEPGEAVRIFTGAPVPEGATAILLQENAQVDEARLAIREGAAEPRHIRKQGQDFRADDILINAGRRLSSRDIMLAAAGNRANVGVVRQPRVAIIATGDELILPGEPQGRDQIVCSSSFGLCAMFEAAGAKPDFIGIARDNPESLNDAFDQAAETDLLVTIGGASVGDHDIVAPVLKSRGMALDFWKIKMRPGKPLMYGRIGTQKFIGLPGNPVSSLICARVFIVPLIFKWLGLDPVQLRYEAKLTASLPKNGPREHYMRAVAHDGLRSDQIGDDWPIGEVQRVTPSPSQDSSLTRAFAQANALILRAPNAPALTAGSTVTVLPIDF